MQTLFIGDPNFAKGGRYNTLSFTTLTFLSDERLQVNQKKIVISARRSMMENDVKYTSKARHDQAIDALLHLLEGLAADPTVTSREWELLAGWVSENKN